MLDSCKTINKIFNCNSYEGLVLVQPNEPDQPDPTQPYFGPLGHSWTLVQIRFIKCIIGLIPNLNPLRSTRPDWTCIWILRANPTRFNLKIGPKIRLNPENGSVWPYCLVSLPAQISKPNVSYAPYAHPFAHSLPEVLSTMAGRLHSWLMGWKRSACFVVSI